MSTTLTLGPQAVLKTSGTVFPNTDKSTCRLKTQVMQLKREASLKDFYLCNNKCDLKGFQTNFETFFLQVSVTIRQLSIRECLRKKSACTLLKKNVTGLANKLKFNDCQTIFSSTTFNDLTVRIIYFHQ